MFWRKSKELYIQGFELKNVKRDGYEKLKVQVVYITDNVEYRHIPRGIDIVINKSDITKSYIDYIDFYSDEISYRDLKNLEKFDDSILDKVIERLGKGEQILKVYNVGKKGDDTKCFVSFNMITTAGGCSGERAFFKYKEQVIFDSIEFDNNKEEIDFYNLSNYIKFLEVKAEEHFEDYEY